MIRRLYKSLFYILILFSITLYTFADSKPVFFDTDFMLKIGESVQIERRLGFIRFIKIVEDSRCPTNVTCVWAGNVKTEFEILDSDRKKIRIYLNSGIKPNKILLKGYSLQLTAIFPSKIKGVEIAAKQYQVKLRVEPAT